MRSWKFEAGRLKCCHFFLSEVNQVVDDSHFRFHSPTRGSNGTHTAAYVISRTGWFELVHGGLVKHEYWSASASRFCPRLQE